MIQENDKITSFQLGVFIFLSIIGVGIISLPASLTNEVKQDAWIVSIIAGLMSLFFLYFICRLGIKYKSLSLVAIIRKVFGEFLGTILAFPVSFYYIIISALEIRIFAETIKVYLLNSTPLEFIIVPLLMLSALLVRSGIEPIARFFEAVLPVVILILIFTFILPLPKSDFSNLRPFLTSTPLKYIGGIRGAIFAYASYEMVIIIFPFLKNPEKSYRDVGIPLLILTVLYTVIVIECIAKLGVKQTQSNIYPVLNLIKSSEVPGAFIERLEGIFISLWVIFVFTTTVAYLYSFSVIIGDIFNQKKRKHIIPIFIPIIYVIALIGESVGELFKIVEIVSIYLGVYTIVFIPITALIVSYFKGKREGRDEV